VQHSIRSIIDNYTKTTRFIFTCNNINNITESIQSRFLIFQINKINNKDAYNILYKILDSRTDVKLKTDNPELKEILNIIYIYTNGDIKSSINYLQMFAYSDNPSLYNFFIIFNIPSFKLVNDMINYALNIETLNYSYKILNELFKAGHSPNDILEIIVKIIINGEFINKHKYLEDVANIYIKMDIAPSEIQIINLLNKLVIRA
jgi:DNA polymerase III delta prime subunit